MADMPATITALKNQLSQPGAWVWLLSVALPDSGPTLRYVSNPEDLTYAGNVYTAFNFSVGSFEWNVSGEIPEVTFRVTNAAYTLQDYMRTYNGLIGGVFSFLYVNSDYLAQDFDEDLTALTIVGTQNLWPDVQFTLSVPGELRGRVPEDRLNPYACRHLFRTPAGAYTARCGYTGAPLVGVTLPAGSAVAVEQTGHGFSTGDEVRLYDIVGITGGLADDYDVTVTDANNFTLDDTDGDDFGGSFTSGKAGYAICARIPTACDERGRFPGNYSGPLGLRREAVRYA